MPDVARGGSLSNGRQVVGLVAPLPPQMGGVVSVAEWLLDHQADIGCRYETFDMWRPANEEMGGKLRLSSVPRQALLLMRFLRWLPRAPRLVHVCVSCSPIGLGRDLAYLSLIRLTGRRAIAHVHGSQLDLVHSSRIRTAGLRLLALLTVERVAVAPWAVSTLARVGVSSRCLLNPIRLAPSGAIGARPASSTLRLLFVGYFGRRKGCPELIESLALARASGVDANLQIVGREERRGEEDELRALVRGLELDEAVDFVGFVSSDRLPDLYQNADVICLPSRREILPMALLEGMAFGLPVLATGVGGIPDVVVDGEMGLLVGVGRPRELAEAIAALATDPTRRQAMGVAARAHVLALAGSEALAGQWRTLYNELEPVGDALAGR